MAWVPDDTLRMLSWFRFAVRSTWVSCALMVGLFAMYFTARVAWHLILFFERTMFANPW